MNDEPMMIEDSEVDAPKKRGPGRPPGAGNKIRPPIHNVSVDKVRPEVRTDSLREAEEYARKLLEGGTRTDDVSDEFYIDRNVIPDGWTYNWKAEEVTGKPNDHHMLTLNQNGWRPVPVSRHPELMPPGSTGAIRKKGLVLMELPKILTDQAEQLHIRRSREELRNSDKRLHETPANTAPREEYPDRLKKTGRDWMTPVSASD